MKPLEEVVVGARFAEAKWLVDALRAVVSEKLPLWSVSCINPSMCALAQALHPETGGQELRQVTLVSMGTGIHSRFLPEQDADWGLVQWAPHLISLVIEGNVGLADYQCKQLLGNRYLRINPILPKPIGLEEVDQIPLLKEVAEKEDLDDAIRWLKR